MDSRVKRAQDARCQESGVDAVVDSDGCDGDACLHVSFEIRVWEIREGRTSGHLDDAVQTVHSVEGATLNRDTDHREGSVGGCHTGQVSGTTGSSDDDLDTPCGSVGGVLSHVSRSAVGRGDIDSKLDTKVVTEELKTRHKSLKVTVRAHDHGNGGGRLREARWLGLVLDVGALCADVVHHVDERLDVRFGLVHRGSGHGDVAHLAAWFGGALAVQVDAGVGDGECVLCGLEVGVWFGAADDVEHDGGLVDFEALRGDGEVEDGADVGIKLGQGAALDGVVAGVVDATGDFAEEEAVVFEEEHFNTKDTLAFEGGDGLAGEFLGLLVDCIRDVPCRGVDELAYRVFLDGFDGGV